jgi:DNA-binding transcriptional LysR family regulator
MAPARLPPPRWHAQPNLARLNLVSMRLVLLCVEEGSLSAAAAAAHLSLSGASARLARLEQAYGRPLFTRQHNGLAPTADGVLVASYTRKILALVQEMSLTLTQPGTNNVLPLARPGTQRAERASFLAPAGASCARVLPRTMREAGETEL